MVRSSSETKEHVLAVAHELFYWNGIRATGVDRVAAEAGVAPTTLYRLFASKDDLVAAYVGRAFEQYRAWMLGAVSAAGPDPRAQILAVFGAQAERIRPELCRGCVFLMAVTEFPDKNLSGHRQSVAAKIWMLDLFRELAGKTELAEPDAIADQLMLVFEGVHASTQGLGHHGPPRQALTLVRMILNGSP